MFELSLITMFVFNNAVSYSSLTVYHNHNKKRTEWKQAQWSTFSDPPKNLRYLPNHKGIHRCRKLTTCPGSTGPGWMLTHSLCLSRMYYLWILDALQTKHTISHLQRNIQFLTSNMQASILAPGQGSHIISLQVRRKEISPSKGEEQDEGDGIPIPAAWRIHPGLRYTQWGNIWLLEPTRSF